MSIGERVLAILFEPIIDRLEDLMATAAELQQQVTEARDALMGAVGRVESDFANLRDQLGDQVDPAALDSVAQGLANLKALADSLDPDPSNPPPQPTP